MNAGVSYLSGWHTARSATTIRVNLAYFLSLTTWHIQYSSEATFSVLWGIQNPSGETQSGPCMNHHWLVVEPYPSEKWWSSSVGVSNFPIYGQTCSKPPTRSCMVMSYSRELLTFSTNWFFRKQDLPRQQPMGYDWIWGYDIIWVNYNISLTWIKAIWGWFPLLTMIPVRSQWGRYNLPRYYSSGQYHESKTAMAAMVYSWSMTVDDSATTRVVAFYSYVGLLEGIYRELLGLKQHIQFMRYLMNIYWELGTDGEFLENLSSGKLTQLWKITIFNR